MSVDFSDWSAAQTPVVTILVLAAIGVMAGVVWCCADCIRLGMGR